MDRTPAHAPRPQDRRRPPPRSNGEARPALSFNVDVYRGTWTSHLVCSGELDMSGAAELEAAVDRVLDGGSRTIIFNGAGITLLTTEAVDALIEAAFLCRSRGVNFEVILSDRSWRIVELLGVAPLVAPRPDPPPRERDFEMPREVADALWDVMGERELYDAFFRDSLAGAVSG